MTAIHRADGRLVLEGRLGCHVCGAEFALENGVVAFGEPAPVAPPPAIPPDPWRIAALLDLRSPSGVVVLQGTAASASEALLEMLPVAILAVNPAAAPEPRERFGVLTTGAGLPLRTGVAAGIAVGDAREVGDAARVLRPGGRLLAPVTAGLPAGMEELARDDSEWVAVKRGGGEAVQLRRR
ncbi:MAG TPA: hypothetical protein VFZ56_09765 [Gemmatimonadaceae bacterium]